MQTVRITGKTEYKTRAHRVLFDRDLPFRPKTETLKTRYTRQPKHRNREDI